MKIFAYILGVIGIIALMAGFALLLTYPTMWALNYVFTPAILLALFGMAKLTFWKTFVLSWIVSLLFKSTSTTTTSK
jgi:hypothetical protein